MVKLRFWTILLLGWAGLVLAQSNSNFLPSPLTPPDNPTTPEKVKLGKLLFSDTRLSANSAYSCASCHQPGRHFTDGLPRAINMFGEQLAFNTPTLYNVAYASSYGWTDQGLKTLEAQHRKPLFNTSPVEMGFTEANLALLQADPGYEQHFRDAFGDRQVTLERIIQSLASYLRSLRPPANAFDDLLFNDNRNALNTDAAAGMTLFFSAELGCSGCHAALTFSGPISHVGVQTDPAFHITGVGGSDTAFRAPTLRAIAHTAPYMHNGSLPTLAQVLDHYQNSSAENIPHFSLTLEQKHQLIEFLKTL